jgi:hypothetical protein
MVVRETACGHCDIVDAVTVLVEQRHEVDDITF